ncbi:MAG: phage protease [Bilophila wadsworthia]
MKQSPLHPLLLSAVADSLRRPFPEIRLLPDGAFAARDGRPGTLTGGNLNAWNLSGPGAEHVLDQWRRRETPLAVDYEHQSLNARHNGQPAPAAGWIESLRYDPGQGLFASVQWTEGAKAFIEQDEYRFISPVFSFNPKNGDVLELKGAALTNVPALDGLGAVAATEDFPPSDTPQPETAMNALNRLKQLLGLPEDAAEETLQAEYKLESLLTPANPAASDPPALPGQPPFPIRQIRCPATPGPRCSTFCRLAILRRP